MLCKGHYQLGRSSKKHLKFGVALFSNSTQKFELFCLSKKRLRGELILASLKYLHTQTLTGYRGLLVFCTKAQVSAVS